MKEDINDEETQVEQLEGQADVQPQPEQQAQVVDGGAEDFKALLTKQNARIKELEGQVAEAAKTKANADKLTAEIEQVKAQAADEYVEFQLKLAGVRNVKVAEVCSRPRRRRRLAQEGRAVALHGRKNYCNHRHY